ncbi:MAG: hypothetical protein AAGJ29_12135, partial [Pseudomonadota bacterium]
MAYQRQTALADVIDAETRSEIEALIEDVVAEKSNDSGFADRLRHGGRSHPADEVLRQLDLKVDTAAKSDASHEIALIAGEIAAGRGASRETSHWDWIGDAVTVHSRRLIPARSAEPPDHAGLARFSLRFGILDGDSVADPIPMARLP